MRWDTSIRIDSQDIQHVAKYTSCNTLSDSWSTSVEHDTMTRLQLAGENQAAVYFNARAVGESRSFATKLRPFRASDKADKYRVITRLIRGYKPPVTNFFLRHWYGLFHPIYSWFLGHLVHWFFRVTSIQLAVPLDWWSTAGTNSGRTSVTGHPGGLVILELQSLCFGLDNSDFLRMSSILKYPEVWFPFFS